MSNALVFSRSTEEEKDYVDKSIVKYNAQKAPFSQIVAFDEINYVTKNEKNEIIAGINSMLYCWGILFVDVLWVNETYRFKGLGKQLLQRVQESAEQKGCSLMHLDTFDFQAKDFYLKQGFEIFGTLENCPPGHTRFYMKKDLKRA